MKTNLFQCCGHWWVFQICWHIECNTFSASSFRIWNSSNGIPSPPLALFIVMLPQAHLTSHSRMSGSWWVIMSSWLCGSDHLTCLVCTRTQEKGAVTPQETDPDLPLSVQESLVEEWVSSGLLQGQGHWLWQCVYRTFWRRLPLSSLPPLFHTEFVKYSVKRKKICNSERSTVNMWYISFHCLMPT